MTSLRTSSFVKHDHLAAPGVVLPGLLGRFTERGRRVLATEDFAELVATIRSGPPPEFFRLRELGLATGADQDEGELRSLCDFPTAWSST